jgi:hypothetical protein
MATWFKSIASLGAVVLAVECAGLCNAVAQDHILHMKPAKPTVSPLEELEILDPAGDPEGKPRSIVKPGVNGLPQIEVPPTIIVHRFYYTGDRDFQGPMLQGGPMIFAANSPATGEQIYVDVLLPPGAPRIKYRRDRIVYEYRDRSLTVKFGHPGPLGLGKAAKPTVSICHHLPIRKDLQRHEEAKKVAMKDVWTRTGVPTAASHLTQSSKQVVGVAADTVHTVGETATAPVIAIWKATPLSSLSNGQVKQPAFDVPGVR